MARKTSKFTLGLFVTIGILIGVMIIIWVGATKYFEKGDVFAIYFDESVQGLQVDSNVKYRGVEVGRVMKIRVAPDNRLVEVITKIQLRGLAGRDVVAQLKTAGITGIVFVELDRLEGKEPVLGRSLSFEPSYPVICSRPSDIKQIRAGLTDIYERVQLIDFAGISDQLKGAAKSVDRFFTSRSLQKAIQNLEEASTSMDQMMKKMDRIVAEGKVDRVLNEAKEGLASARHLMGTLESDIRGMKLQERSESVQQLTDNIDYRTQRLAAQAETLLRSLRENSQRLDRVLERIENKPSDLIFGKPLPADKE